MIERQGADIADIFRPSFAPEGNIQPQPHLLHIGKDIALHEHGTFGDAGGAACILQKGQIIRCDADRF